MGRGVIIYCLFCNLSMTNTSGNDMNQTNVQIDELQDLLHRRGLKCCHINICSLLPKIDELRNLLDTHDDIHILTIGETHLSSEITDSEIAIPNYMTFRKDRNRAGGGVVVYVHASIRMLRREDLEETFAESIWLEILQSECKNILLGSYYRPSDNSDYSDIDFCPKLQITLNWK